MNFCHDGHKPLYKIKYKSHNSVASSDDWFVCEQCFGKPDFFGSTDEIESIVPLDGYLELLFEINGLSEMTNAVTTKLRKTLIN